MKDARSWPELMTRHIAIGLGEETSGYLVPMSEMHRSDTALISAICDARNASVNQYPTRFTASFDSTARWLSEVVLARKNRLLFVVTDLYLCPVGILGFVYHGQSIAEVDSVQRITGASPGLMGLALASVEKFVREQLAVDKIVLRVLRSNQHARKFYEARGYVATAEEDLYAVEVETPNGSEIQLLPESIPQDHIGGEPDDAWVHMLRTTELGHQAVRLPILTAGPSIGPREVSLVDYAVRHGWNANHSDDITKFEKTFAEVVGAEFAIATSSCTGALHLALKALGIGPGDEVLVPDISWVATASAVAYVGAKPVFCEVSRDSWTLCPEQLSRSVSRKTKAILPVHLYGFPADLSRLLDFANSRNLFVIEDAAASVGATYNGVSVGTFGNIGCFSFQGAKVLVGGEGGVAVTNDSGLADRLRKLNSHGRRSGTFMIDEIGHKYAMNNITAALIRAQLKSAERQREQKARLRKWYEERLDTVEGFSFQSSEHGSQPVHWMVSLCVDSDLFGSRTRDSLREYLASKDIDTRPTFPAMRTFPMWRGATFQNSNADIIAANGINLPSGVCLSQAQVEFVCDRILEWVHM